ncbi:MULTISPECIES: TVP38/TMEM64 family protein [unclassified Paenibacillus]|uniref:TVP38/TMEM64 family protein n=1 Tax=unclassified Paenibacillus TaxID=185978 RepID=UPI0024049E47|nr:MULTISPECIES: TVP38/TMEM64 family protein [unclassified Paenibacillus]MDF9840003.1 putative membrane protein YdjX (TVP38/TMEM64 family) [Paenibacillus sp. PastF-2]MDF9846585.1 putative membrane protein YdjX (TVP38/TMEM64 family) [Paenibacillus sp. PastM-2]MDF9853067.1 putative membrane protein YdjX (TVP38/TMEM64 family) [Paenibacillus sp. PastF-1]MDH6478429.1 putative membrane protein YdjX (TVP38/TMEM64 family) [Paenibacillus sp. PastH-2]MDH6506073.1 putative membrane protein YdjX (TVP38/TM
MYLLDISSWLTEERLRVLLEQYRTLGPLPGIGLTFMKSFVPPLPTIAIVGLNGAVYGLWLGFLYSWLGLVAGCAATFLIIRKIASHPYLQKWARRPKVAESMTWVRRSGFSYVFLLSLFPVGPFVVINMAAGLAGMRLRSYLLAIGAGKAIMVFAVSYIGNDVERFIRNPWEIIYVLLFIGLSLWCVKTIEARFARAAGGDPLHHE